MNISTHLKKACKTWYVILSLKEKLIRCSKINEDINIINKDLLLFISADKSNNLYKISKYTYSKLVQDSITKSYKKSNVTLINNINKEAKIIVAELKFNTEQKKLNQRKAFVTLKDRKVNFKNEPKCRLINPAMSKIGILSKYYLELISSKIRKKSQVNQWRNNKSVIEWFNPIKNKSKSSFIKFDIVEFCPPISKELLSKTIAYAQ